MSYKEELNNILSLDLPWEQLRGCNILVTGATGLIGSSLVEVLMAKEIENCNVYAAGRNEDRARKIFSKYINNRLFHFMKMDVNFPINSNVDFHYIIHAASNASPNYFVSNPVEIIKSNIYGVANLCDYGLTHKLRRLLFVSSGEVYGEGDGRVFTEDYSGYVNPILFRSCYPSSKRAAENLCISYTMEYGIDTVIARPSHVYGPYFTETDNRVYAQFIRNVLEDHDILMKSSGHQYRSWCYVLDCVSALIYILLKGKTGEAYNIADNNSNLTIRELADAIADIANKKVIIDTSNISESIGYNKVTKSVFDTSKLELLGWSVSGTMKDKLQQTINELID